MSHELSSECEGIMSQSNDNVAKWCLRLKLRSSSCYNAIRSSGVLHLPSERTLQDYVNWAKPTTGFSTSVDNQLLSEAAIGSSQIPDHHQYVCLVFDKCKVKEDLVYNKHSGELIGYTNASDINGFLNAVDQSCKESEPTSRCMYTLVTVHMHACMYACRVSLLKF